MVCTELGLCLIPLPVRVPKGHQTPFIGRVVILQRSIAVQTRSMILAVSQLSGVKLPRLVWGTTPPYITCFCDEYYIALRAGYRQAVGKGSCFLQLLETGLFLVSPPRRVGLLYKVSQGG